RCAPTRSQGMAHRPLDPRGGGAEGSNVTALSHVAIAVREADPLVRTLVDALGATRGGEELLDDGALRVVFVHLGPVTLELLEPRSADHTVAKFLATRGPGLHHVSFEEHDVAAERARAEAAAWRLTDDCRRPDPQAPPDAC